MRPDLGCRPAAVRRRWARRLAGGALALGLGAALPTAQAHALTVGDAYANRGANACSWTIGTDAYERVLTFASQTYTLTSFKNRLVTPAREYVSPRHPSPEVSFVWDDATLTGARAGWSCTDGSASSVRLGGEDAIRLTVTIARPQVEVTKTYLVYPGESLVRESTRYRNLDGSGHKLMRPTILDQRVMGEETADVDLKHMTGARAAAGSWTVRSTPLDADYARTFDSYDTFNCSAADRGWRELANYTPSGYLGMQEWHDAGSGYVWPGAQHPGPSNDVSRTYTAPTSGTIGIASHVAKLNTAGDGVTVRVMRNGLTIYEPRTLAGNDTTGFDVNLQTPVAEGDQIRFVISNNGNWGSDATAWDPRISWIWGSGSPTTASRAFTDAQGARDWSYEELRGDACPLAGWSQTAVNYIPWFASFNRAERDGVFAGVDHFGRWAARIGDQAGARGGLTFALSGYARTLAANESVTSPQAFTGTYADDLDDMTNRLLDWQYRYMWDYTRPDYFAAVRLLGQWPAGSHWGGNWNPAGITQQVFGFVERMRAIGGDTYHRDYGWWDKAGSWKGPDWRATKDYLQKSGMQQLIYAPAYHAEPGTPPVLEQPDWWSTRAPIPLPPSQMLDLTQPGAEQWFGDLLIGKAQEWGDYQWRNDGVTIAPWSPDKQLVHEQAFRRAQQRFLDQRPGSAIQSVNSGGHEIGWEYLRMSTSFSFTDHGGSAEHDAASRLFPVDKLSGIPDLWNPGSCSQGFNAALMFNPDFTGNTWNAGAIECMRKLVEQYRYLLSKGVAGRWVRQYHPVTTGADADWFQRLSRDRLRGLIVYKGAPRGATTVHPKGLDPAARYDVSYAVLRGSATRTGADLMANGIVLPSVAGGELVYLNLADRPGAGTDTTAPRAPASVTVARGTNMGFGGVEVRWEAGGDDRWVSRYEVLRDGVKIATVAKGRFHFDHSPGASEHAAYTVRTVDGDGNVSAATAPAGSPPPAAETGVDDAPGAGVTYGGTWARLTGQIDAHLGTVSAAAGQCGDACAGFSDRQGGGDWRYQDEVAGRWQEIAAYTGDGHLNRPEWHDAGGGYIWPDAIHPGPSGDTARVWTAPRAGTVDITGTAAKIDTGGDGVVVKITRNGTTILAPQTIAAADTTGVATDVAGVSVAAGDVIRFVIGNNGAWGYDSTRWDPFVRYSGDPAPRRSAPYASYAFTGDRVTYFARVGPDMGKARIVLDGRHVATVDLYAVEQGDAVPVWSRSFGGAGAHTVRVESHGERNPKASAANVSLDGFQAVTTAPSVRAEESDRAVAYAGRWTDLAHGEASGGVVKSAGSAGASATFTFSGRRIAWLGRQCRACGRAEVYLDGAYAGRVDTYGVRGPSGAWRTPVFEASLPSGGTHTIRIEPTGTRSVEATADTVHVDGFEVRP